MPPSPRTKAPVTTFVCDTEWGPSACEGLPFYKEHGGKRYCVLHYLGEDKSTDFDEALQRKLEAEDFDFRGVWFPDGVYFYERKFAEPVIFDFATFNAPVFFDSATFSAGAFFGSATFSGRASFDSVTFAEGADFSDATFNAGADFGHATFNAGASFVSTTFSARADFDSATFSARASFNSATFNAEAYFSYAKFRAEASFFYTTFSAEASFRHATFRAEVDFGYATFKDYVRFVGTEKVRAFGDESSLKLQFARIEKPDRFSFHTLTLSPHWFVNVDARKFEFINVKWNWYGRKIRRKLKGLRSENALPSYHLLEIACRNLALNAEENHLYVRASSFRYLAMNVQRLGTWHGFALWSLGWWYWLASGYSERAGRAFFVLLGVLVLFAALYVGLGFPNWGASASAEAASAEARYKEADGRSRWSGALLYSLGVMTLQKPEPRPATDAAQAVVMLETILGPVQAALLALAIRRKFMR